MILIYPALVSETIPPDYLPAICKVLERYILTVLHSTELDKARNAKDSESLMKTLKENYIFNDNDQKILNEDGINIDRGSGTKKDKMEEVLKQIKKTYERLQDERERLERERERLERERENSRNEREKSNLQSKIDDLKDQIRKNNIKLDLEAQKADREIKKLENEQQIHDEKMKELKGSKVNISTIQLNSDMVLEPTNVHIQTRTDSFILGIKVIPFYISNEKLSLSEMLLDDRRLSKIKGKITIITRGLKRVLWKAFYKILKVIPFAPHSPSTITGDPNKDIILSLTGFKNRVFAIVDRNELTSNFFKSAGGIRRLFGLGWNNLVFVDDINKRCYFCMKKFKGMCSTISFSTMYSSLGNREQLYNSIEAARSAASPFFSTKRRIKMISDNNNEYTLKKINNYKNILNENKVLLDESFIDNIVNRFSNNKKFISDFIDISKKGDVDKLEKIGKTLNIKKVDQDKLKDLAIKKNKDFKKSYDLSYKILDNSLYNIKDEYIKKSISNVVASFSIIISKKNNSSPIIETKNILKSIVPKLQFIDLSDDKKINNLIKIVLTVFGIGFVTVAIPLNFIIVAGSFFLFIIAIIATISLFIYYKSRDYDDDAGNV